MTYAGSGRRWLLGCGIALLVLLIAGGAIWLYASRHLGDLVAGIVKQRAAESLNGRLEFRKLEVDLIGRAVFTDAAVYDTQGQEPVLTCPRAVVTMDFLNFIGPNRGRRAVVVHLYEPQAQVTRLADGKFDLAELVKAPDKPREPVGVSVILHDAQVEFTDACLLAQSYPRFKPPAGLAGQLLSDLGYSAEAPAPRPAFTDTLTVNGDVVVNPERAELALDLQLVRSSGERFSAQGKASTDGAAFDVTLGLEKLELASLASYAGALFPGLSLSAAAPALPEEVAVPLMAGRIERGSLRITKGAAQGLLGRAGAQAKDSSAPVISGELKLAELHYVSGRLPDLYFPTLTLALDNAPQRLAAELDLEALGLHISGRPAVDLGSHAISGNLALAESDLQALAQQLKYGELPLTGALSARAELGGTYDAPQVSFTADSTLLRYGKLELGKLAAEAELHWPRLSVKQARFSGGKLPLSAEGNYDAEAGNGKFVVKAGPLSAKSLPQLLASAQPDARPAKIDAEGELTASAVATFSAGKLNSTLKLQSQRLVFSGQTISNLQAEGNITPPNINLDQVTGELSTAQAVKAAGFKSDGLLKLSFRLGGSISQLPDKPAVLALTGKAATSNLAPEQANISYKIAGPASDPEIRAQLKTTHAEHPLALSATGHYRQGMAPLKASLTWYDTTVDYDGKADFAKRLLEGTLTAKEVDLARFAADPHLSGKLSAKAQLSGSFDQPTVAGKAELPRLAYDTPRRVYELTSATAGFKLAEGNTLSISDGSFNFEGNAFTASGIIGKASKQLTLSCARFNLFSVLALLPPEAKAGTKTAPSRPALDINSAGPLTVTISGDLKNPQAVISYSSAAGAVEGHSFDSAKLAATADLDGITLSSFEVASSTGSLRAKGRASFSGLRPATTQKTEAGKPAKGGLLGMFKPKQAAAQANPKPGAAAKAGFSVSSFSGDATVENFDVAVLTPLTGVQWLADMTGKLQGTLELSGSPQKYSAAGSLRLSGGSLHGLKLSEASAKLSTAGKGIALQEVRISAEGTEVTGSGVLGPGPDDTQISANAATLDLRLLKQFLPADTPELTGIASAELELKPGRGKYPDLQLHAHDTGGGISVGKAHFDAAVVEATLQADVLSIKQAELTAGSSTLNLGGKFGIEALSSAEKGKLPLDLTIKAQAFQLADIAPLLPADQRGLLPGGVLNCNLVLTGNTAAPLMSGTAGFDLKLPAADELPEGTPAWAGMLRGAKGEVNLAKNDLDIKQLELTTSQSGALSTVQVEGGGKLSLKPLGLLSGSIDVVLAPAGQFAALSFPPDTAAGDGELFSGTLGGRLSFTGSRDALPSISGQLVITEQGKTTLLRIKPQAQGEGGPASGYRFNQLKVMIQPRTVIRYAPVDLEAELIGELTLNGRPGVKEGPDRFTVTGQLSVPDGSMYVYKHEIRLGDPDNKLEFAGDMLPYFTGRGVLVLPDALKAGEVLNAGGAPVGGVAQTGEAQDLKVFFNFRRMKLVGDELAFDNPQYFSLSSEPPLPPDKIREKLLGAVTEMAGQVTDVLSGRTELGDFAEQELFSFGSSFISRAIEREFNLKQFNLGGTGSEDNPYYVDVEKQVAPDLSLTYFRNFYSETRQQEEFGVNYKLFERRFGDRYQNLELRVNFQQSGFSGNESEFMFLWTTSF